MKLPHFFKLINHHRSRKLIILFIIDSLLFGTSNSQKVPSVMLIIGFVLLMVTAYQVYKLLLSLLNLYGLGFRQQSRLAAYLTLFTGLLVALQSIGQLAPRDVLVLMLLSVIAYFYSGYNSLREQPDV